jgi:hypothetical protein
LGMVGARFRNPPSAVASLKIDAFHSVGQRLIDKIHEQKTPTPNTKSILYQA